MVCKTCNNRDPLLREILRIDVSTFASITGLNLLGTSTKTTTSYGDYFTHNLLPTLCQGSAKRTYINLEWKYVRGSDVRVNIETEDFVGVYTQIYRNVFGVGLNPAGFKKGIKAALEKYESEVGGMKLFSTPTVPTFVRLVCIGVKDLYATDSSTIVKLIHAIKKCAFIIQLSQQQDLFCWFSILGMLSPLTISEMNDMRFHSHQLTRNTVHLSFLGSEPSEMILVKLLVPKRIK